MAKSNGPSQVHCYHCGHRIEVGGRTMSTSCPGCHKPVIVEDIVVRGYKPVISVETCGRLIIYKRSRVVAQKRVVAHGGIEVRGELRCRHALTAGNVLIGPQGEWKGDLRARSLTVEAGARIYGGYFVVPDDSLPEFRKETEKSD